MAPRRPRGVSILAVLYGLGGAGSILLAGFTSFATSSTTKPPDIGPVALYLLLSALFFLAVPALWKAKRWARNYALVLQMLGVLANLSFVEFALGTEAPPSVSVGFSLFLLFPLVIVYYLTRPHVKSFFAAASAPLAPAPTTPYPPPAGAPPISPPAGEARVFCDQCGTSNLASARFCKACGTGLVSAPAPPAYTPA